MPRHAFRFEFRIDIIERLEPFHFARDPALECACIETRDRANATTPRHERIPECLETDSVGRENAHSGNNDAITLRHGFNYESDLEGQADILAITLNPVIMFLWPLMSTLFTKFSTYSQVASCAVQKKFHTSETPFGEGLLLLYTLCAVRP